MAKIMWDFWDEGEDGFDYCQSIYELASYFKPKQGLEIGVRFGKSALATLLGSPEVQLLGIDPNPEFPVEEFLKERVGDRFTFVNEGSPEALRGLTEGFYDWIYIDGRHDYDGVLQDFYFAWPLLKQGGVMIFDDYDDSLGYGTDVKQVLLNHTEEIIGRPFMLITMEDYGLHPSPHKDAILVK